MISAGPAHGHDPSAWGGLFRSRDAGATWMSANRGHYLSGAIALAVSPTDPNHLLLGAERHLSLPQRRAGLEDRSAIGRDRFRFRGRLCRRRTAGADLHGFGDLSRRE